MGYYYFHGLGDAEQALESLAIAREGLVNSSEILEVTCDINLNQGRLKEAIKALERAVDLSPRDTRLLINLSMRYALTRQYAKADRCIDFLISLHPNHAGLYFRKAWGLLIWKGDIKGARSTLDMMPETDEPIAVAGRWWLLVWERNYQEALEWMSQVSRQEILIGFSVHPRALLLARTLSLLNEHERARAEYESARIFLEEEIEKRPNFDRLHIALGLVYAGLGMKDAAIKEGKLAVELLPESTRVLIGPFRKWELAQIHTMVGDYDAALELIEELLSAPTSWFSVSLLELEPWWDPLRDHPRYEKILEKSRQNGMHTAPDTSQGGTR
jgi:serine/threonine-protein kinase